MEMWWPLASRTPWSTSFSSRNSGGKLWKRQQRQRRQRRQRRQWRRCRQWRSRHWTSRQHQRRRKRRCWKRRGFKQLCLKKCHPRRTCRLQRISSPRLSLGRRQPPGVKDRSPGECKQVTASRHLLDPLPVTPPCFVSLLVLAVVAVAADLAFNLRAAQPQQPNPGARPASAARGQSGSSGSKKRASGSKKQRAGSNVSV